MPRICPHCNHVRKDDAVAPDWQCPACERAYAKARPSTPGATRRPSRQDDARAERSAGLFGKLVLAVAAVALAVFFLRPGSLTQTADIRTAATHKQPEVVLYATSWCGYCAAARRFFQDNGIAYDERDVERSAEDAATLRRLGGVGVPLIVVGEDVIKGYDESELRSVLRPWITRS
jgi:glutaredoxin